MTRDDLIQSDWPGPSIEWPDPTPEMLASPAFEAVWQTIKQWDINVPRAYSGYMGATGAHVRAILDAILARYDLHPKGSVVPGLTLSELRRAAVERQAEWCPDEQPDLSFRGNELAGEVGEACNVIKKLERERHGWRGSRATVGQLAEELADVVICADLAALAAGVDLEEAVQAKFNATSAKNNLATRLPARPVGSVVVPAEPTRSPAVDDDDSA